MSTEPSILHQAARNFALAGIPVFPCQQGGKLPVTRRGFHDATTDIAQIDAWWTANPQYNVAIEPESAGWSVVDLDPPVGEESWRTLCAEHGAPPDTYEVATPRGGRHLYFAGSLPASASKIAPKVDTRGRGSYVLVPPSYIAEQNASYQVAVDRDVAPLPHWVVEAVGRDRERSEAAVAELDTPTAKGRVLSLLRHYAEIGDVAVEGQGGDTRTYKLCAEVLNLGVSEAVALDLILDHWNLHCVPPWDPDEIATKIANAAAYSQNEQAAWAVPPSTELWQGPALDKLVAFANSGEGGKPAGKSRFRPLRLSEFAHELQEPSWLIPGLVQAKGVTQIIGKQKSFKTFLTLDMALSIAAGEETYGHKPEASAVVYAVGENAAALGLRHVAAWRLLHNRPEDFPFYVVPVVPKAMFAEETAELLEQIKQAHIAPSLVVLDTATRAMRGLDENSAKDMGVFSQTCDNIREALDCAVLVVRHTGKDHDRGGRGSNVFDGDVDGTLQVVRHDKSMAVELWVKEIRNAAEREDPYTFEGRIVGPSLVFQPTDAATHRALTRGDDFFEPRKVGGALAELKAYGLAHAVTTHVLASQMTPAKTDEAPEQRTQIVASTARQLAKLAQGPLKAYAEKGPRDYQWSLPSPPT